MAANRKLACHHGETILILSGLCFCVHNKPQSAVSGSILEWMRGTATSAQLPLDAAQMSQHEFLAGSKGTRFLCREAGSLAWSCILESGDQHRVCLRLGA